MKQSTNVIMKINQKFELSDKYFNGVIINMLNKQL